MFCKLSFSRIAVFACLFGIAFSLSGGVSEAQVVKPFKISGEGGGPQGVPLPGDDPRPHWIVGEATHLGRHVGTGSVETESVDLPDPDKPNSITGEFGSGSPFVFEGANGDKLVCEYGQTEFGAEKPGSFELSILEMDGDDLIVEALWVAEFVPQSGKCTGKFEGVTGSWIMIARSKPFVLGSDDPIEYEWVGEGELTFQKPKK